MFRTVTRLSARGSQAAMVNKAPLAQVAQRCFTGDKAASAQAVEVDSRLQQTPTPSFLGMNGMGAAVPKHESSSRTLADTQAISPELISKLPKTLQKFTVQNKVAVVTGGARGLGLNMAQALAESGVKAIAILDIQESLGVQSAHELSAATGIPVNYYHVDITDDAAVVAAVDEVVSAFGSVDVLINSAGVAFSNIKAETYSDADFSKTININVNGSFRIAKAVGRHMIQAQNGGSIIFIASMSGTIVNYPQEQSAYNASKAGVIQLSKSLAAEWAKYNIRVNSISPGYMDTELNRVPALDAQKKMWTGMTPQSRLGDVDELNNLAVYLASDASTFMTGSNLLIDGGYSVY